MVTVDNRIVKASFRECPISDRKLFKYSHCLLPISVGQSAHEGQKFEATLNLINTSFNMCTILLGDLLQRHNLKAALGLNESQAYKESLELGNAWLARNYHAIKKNLKIAHLITRWDSWLNHTNFIEKLSIVRDARLKNKDFNLAFSQTIDAYLDRKESKSLKNVEKNCLNYLEEECAAMILWADGLYDFEVYPSGKNKAMAKTYAVIFQAFLLCCR